MDGQRALQYRRAGVPIQRIATELGYPTPEDALRDIAEILSANKDLDAASVRALELDRLDRLHQALWQKGIDGNPVAIDRLVKISEMRIRLAGVPSAQQGMLHAFDAVVDQMELTTADGALVAAGRRLCEQLDLTAAAGDVTQLSKSMYLIPHLVTVLRELGATPAARLAVEEAAPVIPSPGENDLAAFKAKRKTTA
jgi:hypothetical protein